jgi:hypothetical protein
VVAFDCTSQEKVARSRGLRRARGTVLGTLDAVFDTSCPRNECCAVDFVDCPSHHSGISCRSAFSAVYVYWCQAKTKPAHQSTCPPRGDASYSLVIHYQISRTAR